MASLLLPIILASLLSSFVSMTQALPASQTPPSSDLVPATPLNASQLNTTSPNTEYFTCYEGTFIHQSQRAPTPDCLKAVLRLSRNSNTAVFHKEGAYDDFRLPVEHTHGACSVSVEIAQGATEDKTSWVGISLLASQLTQACSTLNFPSGKTGGETYEGNLGKVRISVGRAGSSNAQAQANVANISSGVAMPTNISTGGASTLLTNGMTPNGDNSSTS